MSAVFEGLPVKSISIENLLNQRDGILTRVDTAIATLQEAQELARSAGIVGAISYRGFDYVIQGEYNRHNGLLDEGAPELIRKRLDAMTWAHLMSESGLRTFMDAKARREWDEKISKLECPAATIDNVRATFGNMYDARGEIFERGVINCFKALSWDYKTNQPFKFGRRLVMRFIRGKITSARGGGTSLGYVNMRSSDELDDLTRVLTVLDGKPEPDHRDGWYSKLNHVNKTTDPDAENDYLRVACFRNGNGHVTFKRPDLVDRMNQILAKHFPAQLPADRHQEAREFEPVSVA